MYCAKIENLRILEARILWLASWMIHNANHNRSLGDGEVKVGGHQASSASSASILTALYLDALEPEDRVAVKPHASPIFHAIQYLAGSQSADNMKNFRGLGGVQSYPSRTKDEAEVDFSTGSVGLGVAQTVFSSLVQDYVLDHGWMTDRKPGRMIALIGDAEMDEGNIYEALFEGWKHNLRNCWWIVDYNRQSLDGVVHEDLFSKFVDMFEAFDWNVVILRHGYRQLELFEKRGGDDFKHWIEDCPNPLYSALTFQGASAWRSRLRRDLGETHAFMSVLDDLSDSELEEIMGNLGGHDLKMLCNAFAKASEDDRPTLFICYTIKGHGLPLAGHKDNHAGLLTKTQMEQFKSDHGVRTGQEWDKWREADDSVALQKLLHGAPFFSGRTRNLSDHEVVNNLDFISLIDPSIETSTQVTFGKIMNEIAKTESELAARIVTTSPDVTVSTNLGGWVNRNQLYARKPRADTFRDEKIPSTFKWAASPSGQHIELGIAEANLMTLLSALGLSDRINGVRLLPVGTVYDPFILRSADQLNYACYQDARFLLVATPSGITLASEGGAHQSISTPLVGLAQSGLTYFEPAFADELAVLMQHAFEYMQSENGGSVYLRLSTRPIEPPSRGMTKMLAADIISGGYWMRRPGSNPELIIAYSGAVAPEAIRATGLLGEDMRDIGLLSVTSADRLHHDWTERANQSLISQLLAGVPSATPIITICDAHPATLSWLGGVRGHPVRALGVTRFGQTGTVRELYREYGLNVGSILQAANSMSARPSRWEP